MKRLSVFTVLVAAFSVSLCAADEKKMTVVDYYLLLPEKTFEAPVRDWPKNAKVIDKQNGYI